MHIGGCRCCCSKAARQLVRCSHHHEKNQTRTQFSSPCNRHINLVLELHQGVDRWAPRTCKHTACHIGSRPTPDIAPVVFRPAYNKRCSTPIPYYTAGCERAHDYRQTCSRTSTAPSPPAVGLGERPGPHARKDAVLYTQEPRTQLPLSAAQQAVHRADAQPPNLPSPNCTPRPVVPERSPLRPRPQHRQHHPPVAPPHTLLAAQQRHQVHTRTTRSRCRRCCRRLPVGPCCCRSRRLLLQRVQQRGELVHRQTHVQQLVQQRVVGGVRRHSGERNIVCLEGGAGGEGRGRACDFGTEPRNTY